MHIKIKENIYAVGVQNPQLRVFDIIMQTEFGTTYNAYLIKGEEKTALVETVHLRFLEDYMENLAELIDIKEVDYLILNHTEPDHTGSLAYLLDKNPNITVVSSLAANKYASAICNMPFNSLVVKHGDTLDLGGKTLQFIIAPFLHWPDSMFTYVSEDHVLFSCDVFGCHYCEPSGVDNKIHYPEKYLKALRYYYDCIFGPFKEHVLAGLDKIKGLEIDVVCPSHGPVLFQGFRDVMEKYREWSSTVLKKNEVKKVLISYVSAYGCTTRMAEAMKAAMESVGKLDIEMIDVLDADLGKMKEKMEEADALLFGSPTINRDALKPIWDLMSVIDALINKGKLCGAFGSYGWSGEAVKMLEERLRGLKLNVFGEGIRANLVPSQEELEKVKEYAVNFATELLK